MVFVRASLVLLFLVAVGCGGGPAPVQVQQQAPPPAADAAKSVLQGVADSGELGSGIEELRSALESMKQSDAAKAEALLKDLDGLEKSSNPEEAKSKAKAMLGKL